MVDAGPVPQLLHQAVGRFRALGDEKRLRLLAVLKDGERNVRALTEECGLGQASASKHLAVLRHAGLVGFRREGASVFYFVRDDSIHELCDIVCDGVCRHAREAHEALHGAAVDGDPMRFPTHGDAAPNDRFAFRYEGVEDPASRVEDWRSLSR